MATIIASGRQYATCVRRKAVRLRSGIIIEGATVGARHIRHREAGFWFLEETIRDDGGAEHRCHLFSDSLTVIGDLRPKLRSESESKPYIIRFLDENEASVAASTIARVADAYATGRLSFRALAVRQGPTTFISRIVGSQATTVVHNEREAIRKAEDEAARYPDAHIEVAEVDRVVPTAPFKRWVDGKDIKAWVKGNLRVGMILILEETQGGIDRWAPTRVVEAVDHRGRFVVELPNGAYVNRGKVTVSGIFDDAPKGQSHILPPFKEAVEAALNYNRMFYQGDAVRMMRDELAKQSIIPWNHFDNWELKLGARYLASPLELQLLAECEPVPKAPEPSLPPSRFHTTSEVASDADEAAEDEEVTNTAVVGYASLRGSVKQCRYARSLLPAFIKARGLNASSAEVTDDDE